VLCHLLVLAMASYAIGQVYISWEAETFAASNGTAMEVLTPPYPTVNSDGLAFTISEASGQFVGTPNDGAADNSGAWFKYDFPITVAGDWYLWALITAPTGADDSFFWGVDIADADAVAEDTAITNIWDLNEQGNFPFGEGNAGDLTRWMWFRLSSRTGPFPNFPGVDYDNPTPLNLAAGRHTFHLIHREGGTFVDKFFVTNDAGFDANEIDPATAVEPQGKLSTLWGDLKRAR
jgi:hypothetical protein